MKKVNIIIGRFQPFTNGHMKCIEEAWNKTNMPTVICMINTKDDKVDERKPFPSSLTLPIYNEFFKNNKMISEIILVNSADIVKISEELKKYDYKICSWTCGPDRYKDYNRMSINYHEQADLSDDFQLIEVQRGDDDISATKVRNALLNDDEKTFNKLTPFGGLSQHLKGHDNVYNILKTQINKVINNDNIK